MRFTRCSPLVDCADFVCQVRACAQGKGDAGWAIYHDDGEGRILWVMIPLEGGVEVSESADNAFRSNLGKFRAPSASPLEGFTSLLVQRRGRVLEVFVNGEAVSEPIRLEYAYAAGKQGIAVWGCGNGDARAECARYTLWRLP